MKRFVITSFLILLILLSGCVDQTSEDIIAVTETQIPAVASEYPTEVHQPQIDSEVELVAYCLNDGISAYAGDWNRTNVLFDDNYFSGCNIYPQDPLSLFSEEAISSLYILWNKTPGEYELTWDGGLLRCGANGFLHEYIEFPEPVYSLDFVFADDQMKSIADIYLFSQGTVPEWVQQWEEPSRPADILVFPTHSDDDALFFGALISHYAIQEGQKVQCAFMVSHSPFCERDHERLNGLWEMGIRRYPVVASFPDSSLSNTAEVFSFYARYDILQWQVENIRRFQPLVVVGHDLRGEYGNGGHKVNAHYLTEAVDLAAQEEEYPASAAEYGVWDTPKLYLHLYPQNPVVLNVHVPLSCDPQNRTAFEIAQDAYDKHISQHDLPFRVLAGEQYPKYDCTLFGLYRSLVGVDKENDIMDNIQSEDWR